jgi:hypothetical protein
MSNDESIAHALKERYSVALDGRLKPSEDGTNIAMINPSSFDIRTCVAFTFSGENIPVLSGLAARSVALPPGRTIGESAQSQSA